MSWRNVVLGVFGAWFVVSPWAMGMTSGGYEGLAVVLGGLTLLGSIWSGLSPDPMPWRQWLQALFGLVLGLSPFLTGMTGNAGDIWTTVLVGAATVAAGIWEATTTGSAMQRANG
jgi:hypothetical protein